MQILSKTNFNFIKWRWHAIVLSTVVIIAGIGQIVLQPGGLKLGIEFSGGTELLLRFEQPVSEDAVRGALASIQGDKSVQRYGAAADNMVLIRLPQILQVEQGQTLDDGAESVLQLLRQANIGTFTPDRTDIVGPAIGADLRSKGIWATITALAGP